MDLGFTLLFSARWTLLALLVFAPWAYGSTRPWALEVTTLWALGATGLRAAGFLARRGRWGGRVPLLLVAAAGGILAQGWWMAANASAIYDPDFSVFAPIAPLWSALPGAVDAALAQHWMLRATGLIGALFIAAEMAAERVWRERLWVTLVVAGGSIAALGVVQRAAGAPTIFWEDPAARSPNEGYTKTFFASFYYHANAGAFLNLCLPLTTALALRAATRPTHPLVHAVCVSAFVLQVLASVMITSRAAQAIALLLFAATAAGPARPLLASAWRKRRSAVLIGATVALLAVGVAVGAVGLDRQAERWQGTLDQIEAGNTRLVAQRAATGAIPEAGALGFGPGCFQAVFPYFTAPYGDALRGFWRYLHADFVQTVVEWGVVGAALWSVVFFGGITRGLRRQREPDAAPSSQNELLLPAAVLGLLGVALHALLDFPLQIASVQLVVAVLLGLCWGWHDRTRREKRRRRDAPFSGGGAELGPLTPEAMGE